MNFITDPIGTRYGCKYTFTNGTIGTFDKISDTVTDGRKVKDPLNIFGSFFKTVNCPDPDMVSITSILTMNTSKTFATTVSALESGTEEVTTTPVDFSKYKSVASFTSAGAFVLTGIPKDQLFVTKDLLGVSDFASGINKITTACTNLNCGMALSTDNTNWYTWNATSGAWISIDLTQSTDTLKTAMCPYATMNTLTQAQYATQFPHPTHMGIALILSIDGTDTTKKYTVDSIVLDYVGDDNDATPSVQYFNFVKTGYTPKGNVVLYADRTIQQGITYSTLYTNKMIYGDTEAPCKVGNYSMRMTLPKTGVSKAFPSEWDTMIANAGTDVTGSKSADDFFNTAITSITSTVAVVADTAGNVPTDNTAVICRGGDKITRYTNVLNSVSGADYGWRPRIVIDVTSKQALSSKPAAVLPVVTDIGQLTKGKCISCDYIYSASGIGDFQNLGSAKLGLLSDYKNTVSGSFYFICVGYDRTGNPICVADRPVATGLSYSTLISSKTPTITGKNGFNTVFDLRKYNIRFFSTVNGKSSTGMANEYDAIFTNEYDNTKSVADIFHNDKTVCWSNTLDANDNTRVVVRGITTTVRNLLYTDATTNVGYRPMFVITPQIAISNLKVVPYVGYALQKSAAQFTCDIAVDDGYGNKLDYQLVNSSSGAILSPMGSTTERVLSVDGFADNATTSIDVVASYKLNGVATTVKVYTFIVYKDGLYRSTSTRTFKRYFGGFNSDNVRYDDSVAAPTTSDQKPFTKTADGSAAYASISAFATKVRV